MCKVSEKNMYKKGTKETVSKPQSLQLFSIPFSRKYKKKKIQQTLNARALTEKQMTHLLLQTRRKQDRFSTILRGVTNEVNEEKLMKRMRPICTHSGEKINETMQGS